MSSNRLPHRLHLAGLALLLLSCKPVALLPPLLSADPGAGAVGVVRSASLTVRFAGALEPESVPLPLLLCGGVPMVHSNLLIAPDTVRVDPAGLLPPSATCSLLLTTTAGTVMSTFQTAAPGAPFTLLHDRRDRNQPLPFPDDYFLEPDSTTATGLRPAVRVPDRSRDVEGLLGVMADRAAASSDGWSPIGSLSVQLSAAPDPTSLPLDPEASLEPFASVGLFDFTPGSPRFGARLPFQLTVRSDAVGSQPLSHNLVLFPGIPLTPEGRYVLALTNGVLGQDDEPLVSSDFFDELRAPLTGGEDPEVVKAQPLTQEAMDALESLDPPIHREDLAVAVRITVRSTDHFPEDVLAMRQDVLAGDPNVQITSVEPGQGDIAAVVRGSFDVPVWRVGAFVTRDAGGRPLQNGTQAVPFILALPRVAETEGLAPFLMYQHGNPGSAQSEVPFFAGRFLADAGFAVGGFTDVLNRTYANTDEQQLAIFGVVLAFGEAPDFYIQTYAEQIAFVHAMKSLADLDLLPLEAPDGVPDLDFDVISYEGISYGSNHAQAFLAYAPEIQTAGLVAGAIRLTELLEYQERTRPQGGPSFLFEVLPSFIAGVTPQDVWMGIALFANVYDRQDPHNHARFIYSDPLNVDGSTQKASILILEGIQDSFTSNNATRSLAVQLGGIPVLAPAAQPVSYLPIAAGPIQGNVDAETTAAMAQFAPNGIAGIPPSPGCVLVSEGHFCPQTAPEAQDLRAAFYSSALSGTPTVP